MDLQKTELIFEGGGGPYQHTHNPSIYRAWKTNVDWQKFP